MKISFYLIIAFLLMNEILWAQVGDHFKMQNYRPVSSTAFQFLKYDEMPVNEYSGIPDISIPIYNIEVDGVNVPLNLTYHAVGNRVNQEASSVGLGWDLNVGGCIVQEINDQDDYDPNKIKMRPDYNESPVPSYQPVPELWSCACVPNPDWTNTITVVEAKPYYSYNVYTAYYIPINGDRSNNNQRAQDLVISPIYDSEPDIFKANFLGHEIKFMKNWKSGYNGIIVLNKQGYKVSRTGDNYLITVPSGDQYYFENNSTVSSYNTTVNSFPDTGTASSPTTPSSRIWFLTKIITVNKKQIVFNYSQSGIFKNYQNYSDKYSYVFNKVTNANQCNDLIGPGSYIGRPITLLSKFYDQSEESRMFLNSIVFPNGEIDFSCSDRNDLLGGKKIDKIEIKSSSKVIKSATFSYSYFDATSVGGNKFQPTIDVFGATPNLRLKLLSLNVNNDPAYLFEYNTIPLPAKNSLAQDFWGFYNGQLINTSLIPNPARLNVTQLCGVMGMADNGNNNSANLAYAQACILTSIRYPTGGKTSFEYELNQFDNYWVPDFTSTTNQLSTGNGLRIHSINYWSDDLTKAKQTIYSYSGGKALIPLQITRRFGFHSTDATFRAQTSCSIAELNAKGYYSTNSLGSGNYVGYDKVTRTEVDANGNNLGRTEFYFNNTPDDIDCSGASGSSALNANLPAKKHIFYPQPGASAENGTVKATIMYDSNNVRVKKVTNEFTTYLSSYYHDFQYGVRFFGYGTFFYCGCDGGSASVPNTLACYYPLYDIESLKNKTTSVEYFNGDSLIRTEYYTYDDYHELKVKTTNSSTDNWILEYYEHANDYYLQTGNNLLLNSNRLTEITKYIKQKSTYIYYENLVRYSKSYSICGDKIVVSADTIIENLHVSDKIPSIIKYTNYDPDNANLLEYIGKDGITNTLLWGYNKVHIVAIIENATFQEVKTALGGSIPDLGAGGLSISQNNSIRSALPNALVTTYTYDPLIGMTSGTAPNGTTTYYKYDSSGRLSEVKNDDGKLLKGYKYRYATN